MKNSPAKKRKLNSRIKDAKDDNHKIIQDEKKKKTKKETEKNDKKTERRNVRVGTPRRIQIKNIN